MLCACVCVLLWQLLSNVDARQVRLLRSVAQIGARGGLACVVNGCRASAVVLHQVKHSIDCDARLIAQLCGGIGESSDGVDSSLEHSTTRCVFMHVCGPFHILTRHGCCPTAVPTTDTTITAWTLSRTLFKARSPNDTPHSMISCIQPCKSVQR